MREFGPVTLRTIVAVVPVIAAYFIPWPLVAPETRLLLLGAAATFVVLVARSSLPLAFFQAALWMGLVAIEPAPVDAVLPALALYALLSPEARARMGLESGSRRMNRTPASLIPLIMALFGIIGFVAVPGAPDVGEALSFQGITCYLALVGAGLTLCLGDEGLRRAVTAGWLVSGLIVSVLGLVALAIPGSDWQGVFVWHGRAAATLKDPNIFGSFVAFPFLVILSQVWISATATRPPSRSPTRRWAGPLLVVFSAAALSSMSRGTWLGLAVSAVVMAAVWGWGEANKRRPRLEIGPTVLWIPAAAMAAVGYVAVVGKTSLLVGRLGIQSYDAVRWATQADGAAALFRQPVKWFAGLGPGSFEVLFSQAAHNTFLRLAVETGVVSLVILILIYVLSVRAQLAQVADRGNALEFGVLGFLVFTFVYGAFIDTLHWRHLWFALAVAAPFGARTARTE